MNNNKLLRLGLVGTIIAIICCFTPALVFLFGVLGLSAFVGYLDIVLLPALLIFAGMLVYALWRKYKND